MPEQQNIEYKPSWHDDYLKWVCGFANTIGGVIGGAIEGLTDRQTEVLNIIAANNRITYKEIASKLSINETAVGEHIKALKEKGAIEREGETRANWKILISLK